VSQSNHQTVSYLTRRFREVGLEPATRHGQNFLIDMNLQQMLVDVAKVGPEDVVLEIGTGTGGLTARIAQHAAAVVTVEIDQRLYQIAREELIDFDNVVMLQKDVLKNKNHFEPAMLEMVTDQLAAGENRRLKLVANLPYNIATPIVANLLSTAIVPHSMTVTLQKELAERITARPSTKDYGHLSIWIQSQCHAELVRLMPPTVFWPRPKVTSAIIHIEIDPERRAQIADRQFFHDFVRSLFFHRRKFLRSVLVSAMKNRLTKAQVDEALEENGHGPNRRAEEMTVEQMLALCETVRGKLPDGETYRL